MPCVRANVTHTRTHLQKHFWAVMRSLSQDMLSAFLRFAWGRTRLPVLRPGQPWPRHLTIEVAPGPVTALPRAHVCFFSIELPK